MTTLITFKKEIIEYAVHQIMVAGPYRKVHIHEFATVLKKALEHSTTDDIQMSLEDFFKIKDYLQ